MDAHEYVFFFQNLNILCIFRDRLFSDSGSVPVFLVDRFNDWSGSGNIGCTVWLLNWPPLAAPI
jgi:hypothetical protein